MHPRKPTRNSDVEKSNFNPLAVRRYNSARPTGAHTSVVRTDQAAAVVDTLPTEAKMLVRGEEGIPASHYQTAYELAFQNTSRSFSGEGVSWSPLIETLIRGESMRQSMQAPCSLSAVDADSALLCLRHLWDVQLGLSLTSGRPRKRDELIFIQTVKAELKALQLILKNREISFSIDEKPSLQLALTHLLLGAVSLNLIKLHEKFPENIRAESTPSADFSNPLRHAHTSAPRDQSALAKLSQAAYDYLEHNGATLPWIHKLQRSDWINEVLQHLGDPSDRENSSSLLELLIRHTETLRKTHQEPIEISLFKVGAYLAAGAGIALFMKYQVPNPFASDNIKASDGTLDFFTPLQASTTEAASMSPSSSESPSQTLTPTQIETLIQTLNRTLTQTLSQLLSASQSASPSPSGTLSQTLTRSQIETLTQTLSQTLTQTLSQLLSSSQSASPSPTPTTPNCNSAVGNFWVETLGGTGIDAGSSLAIAPDGSLVLIGSTTSFGAGGYDVLIAKFQANGSLAWAQTLGGIGDDIGYSLAIAPDGCLLLTGETSSFGAGGIDLLLAKFQANGSLAWAQTLGAGGDYGASLVIAPDGSLFLTGSTSSFGAGTDNVLIAKFHSNGSLAWAQTLGRATNQDYGSSLAIAPDGSLVLTGQTYDAVSSSVLLAKFQTDGSLIWAQTLEGTNVNAGESLAITQDGNLVLTGLVNGSNSGIIPADVLLAKFQANGSLVWAQTFGGAGIDIAYSLVIAPDGNLALTGQTNSFGAGGYDVLIAKFQANGSLAWAQTLGGSGNDYGRNLAITSNGSLLLTGQTSSFGVGTANVLIAQLNSDGSLPFPNSLIRPITTAQVQFINPTIINITSTLSITPWNINSRAWTTANISSINATLKNLNCVSASTTPTQTPSQTLSPSASPPNCNSTIENFWIETLGGGSGNNFASSLVLTSDESLVFAGSTTSFGAGNYDVLVAKIYLNGTLAWAKTFGGVLDDEAYSITLASDGTLWVAGFTRSFGAGNAVALIIQLTSDGHLMQAQTLGGINDATANDLIIAPDGSFALTGYAENTNVGYLINSAVFVAQFQSNGSLAWTKILKGGTALSLPYNGHQLVMTPENNLVVVGSIESPGWGDAYAFLMKFESNGTLTWVKVLSGIDGVNDYDATRLVIASDGSLVLGGTNEYVNSLGVFIEPLLANFLLNGTLVWAQKLVLGQTPSFTGLYDLVVASDGSLLFSGLTDRFSGGSYSAYADVIFAKFQSNGSLIWAQTLALISGGYSSGGSSALAIASDGSLLLSGDSSCNCAAGTYDSLIARLNPAGMLPFNHSIIQPIPDAQMQSITPNISDITQSINISSWNASLRNWTSISVSDIYPSLRNLNCISPSAAPARRRLEVYENKHLTSKSSRISVKSSSNFSYDSTTTTIASLAGFGFILLLLWRFMQAHNTCSLQRKKNPAKFPKRAFFSEKIRIITNDEAVNDAAIHTSNISALV